MNKNMVSGMHRQMSSKVIIAVYGLCGTVCFGNFL